MFDDDVAPIPDPRANAHTRDECFGRNINNETMKTNENLPSST